MTTTTQPSGAGSNVSAIVITAAEKAEGIDPVAIALRNGGSAAGTQQMGSRGIHVAMSGGARRQPISGAQALANLPGVRAPQQVKPPAASPPAEFPSPPVAAVPQLVGPPETPTNPTAADAVEMVELLGDDAFDFCEHTNTFQIGIKGPPTEDGKPTPPGSMFMHDARQHLKTAEEENRLGEELDRFFVMVPSAQADAVLGAEETPSEPEPAVQGRLAPGTPLAAQIAYNRAPGPAVQVRVRGMVTFVTPPSVRVIVQNKADGSTNISLEADAAPEPAAAPELDAAPEPAAAPDFEADGELDAAPELEAEPELEADGDGGEFSTAELSDLVEGQLDPNG